MIFDDNEDTFEDVLSAGDELLEPLDLLLGIVRLDTNASDICSVVSND